MKAVKAMTNHVSARFTQYRHLAKRESCVSDANTQLLVPSLSDLILSNFTALVPAMSRIERAGPAKLSIADDGLSSVT